MSITLCKFLETSRQYTYNKVGKPLVANESFLNVKWFLRSFVVIVVIIITIVTITVIAVKNIPFPCPRLNCGVPCIHQHQQHQKFLKSLPFCARIWGISHPRIFSTCEKNMITEQ